MNTETNKIPSYFNAYQHLNLSRNEKGVLLVEMHTDGGPIMFSAKDHTEFTEAFYRIGRDLDNKVIILTGKGDWMSQIDADSFLNNPDPYAGIKIHDEGVQILENLLNIRVPVIAAIEGKAHIHTEYALTANIIVASESTTFMDLPHFNFGVVPGDGIFSTWSYRAGAGRAQDFLLKPESIDAQTAKDWGVVSEIVEDGNAVNRAREIADLFLSKPAVTLRNTRAHFSQPLKEKIVREVSFGLTLETQAMAEVMMMQQNENK